MSVRTPDISEIDLENLEERPFPSRPDYRIAISSKAYDVINNHVRENTEVELCGVLIGEVFKDTHGPFLEITDAIRGEHAENQGAQVTFTHETWTHINNTKDSEFPEKSIVGWYHSHPRFGIFLSPQDLFIHDNFFNQPSQTAFVIDPVSKDEGFFTWQDGEPVRIKEYCVGGRKKKPIENTSDSQKPKKQPPDNLDDLVEAISKSNKGGTKIPHVFFGLLIITSIAVVYLIKMNINYFNKLLSAQKAYLMDFSRTQSSIETSMLSFKQYLRDLLKKARVTTSNNYVY